MMLSRFTMLAVLAIAFSKAVAVDPACVGSSCDSQDAQVLLQSKLAVDKNDAFKSAAAMSLLNEACSDNPSLAGVASSDIRDKGYAANAAGVSSWCTSVMGNPVDCSGKLPQWLDGCQKTCGKCGQAGGCHTNVFAKITDNQWSEVTWELPESGTFTVTLTTTAGQWGAWGKDGKPKAEVQKSGIWVSVPGHGDGSQPLAAAPLLEATIDATAITGVRLHTPTWHRKDSQGTMAVFLPTRHAEAA